MKLFSNFLKKNLHFGEMLLACSQPSMTVAPNNFPRDVLKKPSICIKYVWTSLSTSKKQETFVPTTAPAVLKFFKV